MRAAQQAESRNPFRLLMRVPVPWVFVLTYLVGVVMEYVWPTQRIVQRVPGIGFVSGVLFLIGASVAAWGLLTFRKARTTTVPGKLSSQLVTWGPYRFTRNPMYLGLTLAYLGEAGVLRQVWPVVLLPLVIAYLNWVVIPVEEEKLREVFGSDYNAYRANVRRWL
jgi:protein-S-isoprenylcysteine O-methyltransferase Ste14